MSGARRLFMALNAPETAGADIERAVAGFAATAGTARVAWVPPAHYHLTLLFLGDVDEAACGPLARAVDGLSGRFRAPFIETRGIVLLPGVRAARVVCLDCAHRPGDDLRVILEACTAVAGSFGISPDPRPWRAHLTVGRIREGTVPPGFSRTEVPSVGFRPEGIDLMESVLRPSGPSYSILARGTFA